MKYKSSKSAQRAALAITTLPDGKVSLNNIEEIIDRETKTLELLSALKSLLNSYAPGADKTAKEVGENNLHSAVRDARALIRELDKD